MVLKLIIWSTVLYSVQVVLQILYKGHNEKQYNFRRITTVNKWFADNGYNVKEIWDSIEVSRAQVNTIYATKLLEIVHCLHIVELHVHVGFLRFWQCTIFTWINSNYWYETCI